MQFINKDRVQARLPLDWDDYVQRCWDKVDGTVNEAMEKAIKDGLDQEAIELKLNKTRKEAISKRAALWRLFAKNVASVNHGKCWYCESKEDRSRMPVDHYRPKAAVDGCQSHDGYWWLAFDWENYRYCCTLCNSLTKSTKATHGKGDKFPLVHEARRCISTEDDLDQESPILLDPFKSRDVRLITFLNNGVPTPNAEPDTEGYNRANQTIDILNLREGKVRITRLRIGQQIGRIMKKINSLLNQEKAGENVDGDLELFENQLSEYLDEEAQHRTAAKIYFKGYRSSENSDWYDEFLARL